MPSPQTHNVRMNTWYGLIAAPGTAAAGVCAVTFRLRDLGSRDVLERGPCADQRAARRRRTEGRRQGVPADIAVHKEGSPKAAPFCLVHGRRAPLRGLLERRDQRLQHARVLLIGGGERLAIFVLGDLRAAPIAVKGHVAPGDVGRVERLIVFTLEAEAV